MMRRAMWLQMKIYTLEDKEGQVIWINEERERCVDGERGSDTDEEGEEKSEVGSVKRERDVKTERESQ